MIVIDTSAILAFMNRGDSHHEALAAWFDQLEEVPATTPLVLAELDHLVTRRGGTAASRALRDDLAAGAYAVEWWPGAVADVVAIAGEHAHIGLTDASLVALAARLRTIEIATLDERHFRAIKPLTGEPAFALLPADA